MRYLLGTDEAGYGPHLGPLVVAASAWELPDRIAPEKLYTTLGKVVCREKSHDGDTRLAIADSKQLYQAGGTLAQLERGVLAMLAILGRATMSWVDCWRCFECGRRSAECGVPDSPVPPSAIRNPQSAIPDPWHDGYDEPLPVATCSEDLTRTAALLAGGCEARQVRLAALAADVLSPRRFNDELTEYGNKAEVLSLTTLRLARRLVDDLPPGEVIVACDKHGGRAYYAALLQHVFDSDLVRASKESPELSVYELVARGRTIEFRFMEQGERMLPTALASMTAKYLRELGMRPFNAFWKRHVPGLKATAGYSTDAGRFYREIRAARERLGIDERDVWRQR